MLGEQVIQVTAHPILSFLSVRDVFKSFLGLNHISFQKVFEHYIYQATPRTLVQQGNLNEEDSKYTTILLLLAKLSAYYNEYFKLRGYVPRGDDESDIIALAVNEATIRSLFSDEQQQLLQSFTYLFSAIQNWTSSSKHLDKGICDMLHNRLLVPDAQLDIVSKSELLATLDNEVRYWAASRLCGFFFKLFEREDGTIFVSEDFQQVYLVASLPEWHPGEPNRSANESSPPSTPNLCLGCHMSVFGKPLYEQLRKVGLLLFPYKGIIVAGKAFYSESVSQAHIREAFKTYTVAQDNGTIITAIRQVDNRLNLNPINEVEMSSVKAMICEGLAWLKTLPQKPKKHWQFNLNE